MHRLRYLVSSILCTIFPHHLNFFLVFILFLLQLVDLSFLSASAIFRMLVALLVFEPGLVVGSLNPRMDACKQTHGSFVLHQDFGYLSI